MWSFASPGWPTPVPQADAESIDSSDEWSDSPVEVPEPKTPESAFALCTPEPAFGTPAETEAPFTVNLLCLGLVHLNGVKNWHR